MALASMSAVYADNVKKNNAKVTKQDKKSADKRVCKRQKVTGSRIAERVCRKQSEWDRLRDHARQNVEDAKEKSSRSVAGDG